MSHARILAGMLLLIAAGAHAASGGEAFGPSARDFLLKSADLPVHTPATAPAADDQDALLERARLHHRALSASGAVRARATFAANKDPEKAGSPAYTTFDFARRLCTVTLNAEAAAVSGYDEALMERFMIYHELAHCDLFAAPHEIRAFPQLSPLANRMISDLVHLEFLGWLEPGRPNGYIIYQETYADVKALALMIAEGETPERLGAIYRRRAGGIRMPADPHATEGVFEEALSTPWRTMDAGRLDDRARSLADRHIVDNFLRPVFQTDNVAFDASSILTANLRTPLSGARSEYSPPEVREFLRVRHGEVAASAQDAWRLYSGLARSGMPEQQVIDGFFRARYGAGPEGLQAEDAALRAALGR